MDFKEIDRILAMDKSSIPKKRTVLNSDIMKAYILEYLRFQRNIFYVATEVRFADVMYYHKTKRKEYCVEIEIKTSRSDFKNDFKKCKHQHYQEGKSYNEIQPDYFYYCFPNDLYHKDDIKKLKLPNSKYGIYVMSSISGNYFEVKPAERLTEEFNPINLKKIVMRMSSEIAQMWIKKVDLYNI